MSPQHDPFPPPWEGYSVDVLVDVCGSVLQTLTLFQTKICDCTLFQTWLLNSRIHKRFQTLRPKWSKSIPYFRPNGFKNHIPGAAHTCIACIGEYSPLPPRGSMTVPVNDVCFFIFRYQDTHNQSFIMVVASGRWLGVRLDLLCALFIGAVAVMAILMSQDAGT